MNRQKKKVVSGDETISTKHFSTNLQQNGEASLTVCTMKARTLASARSIILTSGDKTISIKHFSTNLQQNGKQA